MLRAIATAGTMDTFAFLKQRLQGEELNVLESAVTLIWAFHSTQTDALILKAAAVSIYIYCFMVNNSQCQVGSFRVAFYTRFCVFLL